jgi:hypothetical protein
VPWAILRDISRGCGSSDSATPASMTISSIDSRRANTDTGSCPVSNWRITPAVLRTGDAPAASTASP